MQIFFAKRKSTPIRIMACFKDHALADMLYILHIKESQLVFFLKPLGKESKMEPHSFLCPWLHRFFVSWHVGRSRAGDQVFVS